MTAAAKPDARRRTWDVAEVIDWRTKQGWTLEECAEELGRRGVKITPQGVYLAIKRHARETRTPVPDPKADTRLLPWKGIKGQHSHSYVGKALRLVVRRAEGEHLSKAERASVTRFIQATREFQGGGWAWDYEPTLPAGFHLRLVRQDERTLAGVLIDPRPKRRG